MQAPAGTTLADPANVKAMDDMLASIRGIDKVADSAKVDPATATPEQAAKALVNPVTGNDSMVAMFKEKAAAAGTSETQAVDDRACVVAAQCRRHSRVRRGSVQR